MLVGPEFDIERKLSRLRALCAADDGRLDLLEAALALSVLRSDALQDLSPFRQHVATMASDLADLVHRRGASPEQLAEIVARSYGYRGDTDSYDDLQNADLVRVIERRKGLPVARRFSISMSLARRAGTPKAWRFPPIS